MRNDKPWQWVLARLRAMGVPLKCQTARDRAETQHRIYLAQELLKRRGMTLGIEFCWGARGPRSPYLERHLWAEAEARKVCRTSPGRPRRVKTHVEGTVSRDKVSSRTAQ